jgi:hypothetical protein
MMPNNPITTIIITTTTTTTIEMDIVLVGCRSSNTVSRFAEE